MNDRAWINKGVAEIELRAEIEYDYAEPEPSVDYGGWVDVTKLTINGRVCTTFDDVVKAVEKAIAP